jgi:Tol biopolymer transport system component
MITTRLQRKGSVRGIARPWLLGALGAGLLLAGAGWLLAGRGGANSGGLYTLEEVMAGGAAEPGPVIPVVTDTAHEYWGPAWSPDGTRLVFTLLPPHDPVGDLYLAGADGTGLRRLTQTPGLDNYLPDWSPDGKEIAFIGGQHGTDESTSELYVIDATGQNLRQLTHNTAQEYGVSWAPDGRRLVFGSKQSGTWQIYTINADGTGQTLLDSGGGNAPAWSPDGRTIAFTSDRAGHDSIYLMDAAGGHVRRLTLDDNHDDNAAWAPDGRRLTYAATLNGTNDIFMIDADGGHPRNLTNSPNRDDIVPRWSPDGRVIIFSSKAVR